MQQQTQPTQGQFGQQGSQLGQQGQTGGQLGQQRSQQQGHQHQGGQGLSLRDVETPEQRQAIEDIERSIQVCGFCADQCIQEADPTMIECIRLCEDVQELGEATLALLPRNSRFGGQVLQTFQQAAQACAQECGQHSHAHCQDCAQTLSQAVQSIQQYVGGGQQMGMQQPGMQ